MAFKAPSIYIATKCEEFYVWLTTSIIFKILFKNQNKPPHHPQKKGGGGKV
jgi:hypothetical protein